MAYQNCSYLLAKVCFPQPENQRQESRGLGLSPQQNAGQIGGVYPFSEYLLNTGCVSGLVLRTERADRDVCRALLK